MPLPGSARMHDGDLHPVSSQPRPILARHLVLVEGYFSVFRMSSLAIPSVALMGCTLSKRQNEPLRDAGVSNVTLLLDSDGPGRQATEKLLPRLAHEFFVCAPMLPFATEPDTADEMVLRAIVKKTV